MYCAPASTKARAFSAACSAVIPCFVGWNSRPFKRQPITKSGPHASRMPSMISRTMRVRFSTFWHPYSSSRLFHNGLTKLSRKYPCATCTSTASNPPFCKRTAASICRRCFSWISSMVKPRGAWHHGLGTGISSSESVDEEIGAGPFGFGPADGPMWCSCPMVRHPCLWTASLSSIMPGMNLSS